MTRLGLSYAQKQSYPTPTAVVEGGLLPLVATTGGPMTTPGWSGHWRGRQPAGDIHYRAREVVRSTGGIVRGKFPSRKNGRMIHHEGLLELDAIYHFETSPCIARYREQVATIHYADGARLRRYTPDFELHLTSGDLVLVEIKPEAMLSDPDTLHKFNRVAEHFERAAQAFEIVTDIVIRAEPRMTNLRTIYQRASRVPMTDEAMSAIANRYRHLFPMTIGQSTEMMRRGGITPYCLLLADLVRCALTQPLVDATPLYVSEEPNHATLLSQKRLGF